LNYIRRSRLCLNAVSTCAVLVHIVQDQAACSGVPLPIATNHRGRRATVDSLTRAVNSRHTSEANRSCTADRLSESRTMTLAGVAATSVQAPLATLYLDFRQVRMPSCFAAFDIGALRIEDDRNVRVPSSKRNLRARDVSPAGGQNDRSSTATGPLNLNRPNPIKRWKQSSGPVEPRRAVASRLQGSAPAPSGRSRSRQSWPSR